MDYEGAASEAGWTQTPEGRWWRQPSQEEIESEDGSLEVFLGSGPIIFAEGVGEAQERDNLEPHDREVFEHWAVTEWFGRKLQDLGERVDFAFGSLVIWARTTTGQAIYADHVVEVIAAALLSDTGEA